MSEVSTFRCDECGKLKEEANHWYKALVFRLVSGCVESVYGGALGLSEFRCGH